MNEQQLRRVIRQVILESEDRMFINEGALYDAFIEPFVDVVKAIKLTSQDVLNTFKFAFETLITISPKKLVEARRNYEETRKSIQREWDPIVKKAEDAIEGSDFGLAAFAMAPNLFFGYQIGKLAKNAPASIVDYFDKSGWDVPLRDFFERTADEESTKAFVEDSLGITGSTSRGSSRRSRGENEGVLDKLRIFFFGENANVNGNLIIEQNSEEKLKTTRLSSKNIDSEISKYFKEKGMDKSLRSLAESMLEAKRKHADELKEAAGNQINALKMISSAQTLVEFEKAVNTAATSGADVAIIQQKIETLKKDLEKKVNELQNDVNFIKSIRGNLKGKEVTDAQIADAAKKSAAEVADKAIVDLKQEIASSLTEAMKTMKKQILDELSEGLPSVNDPLYTQVMSTPMGKKMKAILDDAVAGLG